MSSLQRKLEVFAVAVNALGSATWVQKAALAEGCIRLALDLVSELVARVEKLENERVNDGS